jgi:ferredoxin--NADP+ reductase
MQTPDAPPPPPPTAPGPQYTAAEPLLATVLENRRLTHPDNPSDVHHLVLSLPANALQFAEGQAVGVAPPGLNRRGRPHPPRLFSVASARDGELGDGATLALTVKRFYGQDPQTGAAIPGLASHHLCDSRPGDEIRLSGPIGELLTLPDPHNQPNQPNQPSHRGGPLLLFATGTGIAPMRGILQRRSRSAELRVHPAVLIHGAPTLDDLAYHNEFADLALGDPSFTYLTARSREQQDERGGRLYVGALAVARGDLLLPLLQHAHAQVLVCGVRGMEDGVETAIAQLAGAELLARLKAEKRLRVEVY